MLVLVIEDDIGISESLCQYVSSLGIECVSKSSIEEGLKALRELKPNILILDLLLNGKMAFEVIKEAQRIKNPPCLVLCTALNNAEKIAEEYNVHYLLKKPFDIETIDEIIHQNSV